MLLHVSMPLELNALRSNFHQTEAEHLVLVVGSEPVTQGAADLVGLTAVTAATRDNPVFVLRRELQGIAFINRSPGRRPFPNVADQILNAPAVCAEGVGSHR